MIKKLKNMSKLNLNTVLNKMHFVYRVDKKIRRYFGLHNKYYRNLKLLRCKTVLTLIFELAYIREIIEKRCIDTLKYFV